jgi:hypothetical protein
MQLVQRCELVHKYHTIITYRTYGRYTHSYISDNEERPECIPCNSNCSIKHILIDCVDVADVRQTLYNVNTIPGIRFIYKCRRRHNTTGSAGLKRRNNGRKTISTIITAF